MRKSRAIYPRPTKICETCKGIYEKPINLGVSHWVKRRFCSKKCQYKNWERKNELSYAWKGENVLVYTKHTWLYKNYGKANKCELCFTKTSPRYEWALKKGFDYEKKRENYMMLCKRCHVHYDDVLKYLELGRGENRDYYKNKKGGDLYGN